MFQFEISAPGSPFNMGTAQVSHLPWPAVGFVRQPIAANRKVAVCLTELDVILVEYIMTRYDS